MPAATAAAPFPLANDPPRPAPSPASAPPESALAVSLVSHTHEEVASRSARVEYTPPIPTPVLELLQTSPPVTPVSSHPPPALKPFAPAPSAPHPHFLSKTTPMNQSPRPRRPKTADSSAPSSKDSFKRAFASVFSPNAGRTDSRSPSAPFQLVSAPAVSPMDQATRRLRAMEIARETGRKAVAYVRRKLNSKTPQDQLPKTWPEYEVLYANVRPRSFLLPSLRRGGTR